ncbi:MAG: MFS transporter [Pirellulaceae bacterium]
MSDEQPNPYRAPQRPPAADGCVPPSPLRAMLPLLMLFGLLYFVQGIVEPTAGLLAQPMRRRLMDWGQTTQQVGIIFAYIGIPWSLKPLFGLVSDFFPLGGRRRKPYLALATAATALAFFTLAAVWHGPADHSRALWLLLAACGAVAMTDVVIDALAVERGQPLGLTGQMQAVQWGTLSVATILAGTLGGYVSQHRLLEPALVGCGVLGLVSLAVVLLLVHEPKAASSPRLNVRAAWSELRAGRRIVVLLAVGLYLFLWNFNPFSYSVLQNYATEHLLLSEQFFGNLYSIQAAAGVVACAGYFLVCRRIPMRWLIHASIAAGVLSTLCYLPMQNATTAVAASLIFGLTYQTATLIQLDLAARVCPTQSAGTMFAILMAISNTGVSAASYVGGGWYDDLAATYGSRHVAFDLLVLIGVGFTASCWLLVPVLRWAGVK